MRFIRDGGNVYEVFADKEVIVSASAINSPHLLMLSGIGPREELEKHQVWIFPLSDQRYGAASCNVSSGVFRYPS